MSLRAWMRRSVPSIEISDLRLLSRARRISLVAFFTDRSVQWVRADKSESRIKTGTHTIHNHALSSSFVQNSHHRANCWINEAAATSLASVSAAICTSFASIRRRRFVASCARLSRRISIRTRVGYPRRKVERVYFSISWRLIPHSFMCFVVRADAVCCAWLHRFSNNTLAIR